VRSTRKRGPLKHVAKTVDDLFSNRRYDDLIACRTPQLPGTVDQKIVFKATAGGINIEAEYTNKWWTKPVPLTVAAHTLHRELFENNMDRFENLFCKKLSH
jgi:hypothetical protein